MRSFFAFTICFFSLKMTFSQESISAKRIINPDNKENSTTQVKKSENKDSINAFSNQRFAPTHFNKSDTIVKSTTNNNKIAPTSSKRKP